MKKRKSGVSRLLKARQQLKNVAKELGIDLKEVFEDAAVLKRKHEADVAPKAERSIRNQEVAGLSPAVSFNDLAGQESAVVVEDPAPLTHAAAALPPDSPTDLFNEPAAPAEQPKEFGATGTRCAEPNPAIPAEAPYYWGRCAGCNGEMLTRDNKLEDVCETCAVVLRDDAVQAQQKMIEQAGGQLVNPFREEDF